MNNKLLASLSLSKVVLDRTPQEVIELLLRLFKRHRDRKEKAGALVRHLMREWDSLWTFLHESGVAATNNHAERLLRFPMIWRKRSFIACTRQGEKFAETPVVVSASLPSLGETEVSLLGVAFERYLSGSKPAAFFFRCA